jgi:acetyl-CoA carboxylase biotin carboxyl carrier protein
MPKKRMSEDGGRAARQLASPRDVTIEPGTTLDVDALRQIVEILETSDVTRLSWRRGRERLVIRRGPAPQTVMHSMPQGPSVVASAPAQQPSTQASAPAAAAPAPAPAAPAATKPGHVVSSPFVGTFYRTPAPDQPPFVEVGSTVKKGQVLCIVEAMKLMNEIESEVGGKIAEILVENGTPVEFGQALFRIEPA